MRRRLPLLAIALLAAGAVTLFFLRGAARPQAQDIANLRSEESAGSSGGIPIRRDTLTGEVLAHESIDRTPIATDTETLDAKESEEATVNILVRSHEYGTPIRNAPVWIFVDEIVEHRTDARGCASFTIRPGKHQIGAEPPPHTNLVALPYHRDTGEPAAESYVAVMPGETARAELVLYEGASITGRVLHPNGDAVRDFTFLWSSAVENRWVKPKRVSTDDAGSFAIVGLDEGWYLLGTHPDGNDFFPNERISLSIGENRDLDVQLVPKRSVEIVVQPTVGGEAIDDPRPSWLSVDRLDGLGDLGRRVRIANAERQSFELASLPHTWKADLFDGEYRVVAIGAYKNWLAPRRHEFEVIEVTEATSRIVIEYERVSRPNYATIETHRMGPAEYPFALVAKALPPTGRYQRSSVQFDRGQSTIQFHVDCDYVQTTAIQFVDRGEVLREVPLVGPRLEVSLTLDVQPVR